MPMQNSPLLLNTPQLMGEQASLADMLNDIKMRIVDCTPDLSKDRVFFSKHTDEDLIEWAPHEIFVALSIPKAKPNSTYISGGGNYNTQLDGSLVVRIFVRNEGDLENRSYSLMSDKIVGEWATVQKIMKALSMWTGPIDQATNTSLFNRPMLINSDIDSLDKSNKSGAKSRWGVTKMSFQLPFVMDLEYPYPTGPQIPTPPGPPPPGPPVPPPVTSVVTSINGLSNAIILQQGPNITITPSGQTFIFSANIGVSTVNGIAGGVTLQQGSNITITPNGQNLLISSTVGGITQITAGSGLSGGGSSGNVSVSLNAANVNAWSGQQYFAAQPLTDGASIAWNLNTQQAATLTIGGNHTLANPTNMVNGGTYTLIITQGAGGSHTLAYGSNYFWSGGTAPTLSTAAGAIDILTFVSDGTNMYGSALLNFQA